MMKVINGKNYGSIPHLSGSKLGIGDHYIEKGQETILLEKTRDRHDTVLVFEKYDGSNVGVIKLQGKILPITRTGYLAVSSPYKQHHLFADWVRQRESVFTEMLAEGERIVGEWLAQVHGLQYEIEGEPIVFFDYFNANNKRILYDEFLEKMINYFLPISRLIHKGNPKPINELLPILHQKDLNFKSVELPEGMVFRVERKGKVDFLAKWVRSDFENGKFCIGVNEKDLLWNIPYKAL